jgi:ubiquinone/menaquinone biosynthesis C-methylase UbiE
MAEQQIRYEDGAAYERQMGAWSRLAGDVFLDWLRPPSGLRWIDVGCGNGAFTQLLIERCAPAEVQGIDPSAGQLAYARKRLAGYPAQVRQGDAMALPFAAATFDAAVMALVIGFVPDPARGAAEMVRVVKPGSLVAAYAWDMPGGGFPLEPMAAELRAMGLNPPRLPSPDIARQDALHDLWAGTGLVAIKTREITVKRTFDDFEDFWTAALLSPSLGPLVAGMAPADAALLKSRVRARLGVEGPGPLVVSGRTNAIRGRVPG